MGTGCIKGRDVVTSGYTNHFQKMDGSHSNNIMGLRPKFPQNRKYTNSSTLGWEGVRKRGGGGGGGGGGTQGEGGRGEGGGEGEGREGGGGEGGRGRGRRREGGRGRGRRKREG